MLVQSDIAEKVLPVKLLLIYHALLVISPCNTAVIVRMGDCIVYLFVRKLPDVEAQLHYKLL